MSAPAYAIYLAAGATGVDHSVTSPEFTDFIAGQPLYLSYELKATRVSGTANATLRATLLWYNSAGGQVAANTYDDVVISGSISTLKKFKYLPPAGAVKGTCEVKITPAASPMQHDVYVQALRLGKTELFATNGATWGVDVGGIPDNLKNLLGNEAILNAAILSSIADDNVLNINEKATSLREKVGQLETAYSSAVTRATTLGISTAILSGVRDNWQILLNSYNPAWTDIKQDTTIYTPILTPAQQVFPAAWNPATLSSYAANGPYTTLTDSDPAAFKALVSPAFPATPGQSFSTGCVIKKKTATCPFAMLRLGFSNGSGGDLGVQDIVVNAYSGAYFSNFGSLPAGTSFGFERLDLGTDWFFRITIYNVPAATAIGYYQIYPAIGGASDPNTNPAYDTGATGSIDVLGCPVISLGDWYTLGRAALVGRYNQYIWALQELANAISAVDSSISNYVDGPTSANITYDNTGTTIQATVDLNFLLRSGTGSAAVTTGVSYTWTVLSGTVNGANSSTGAQSANGLVNNTGVGTLTISSMTSDTAQIKISVTANGVVRTYFCALTRSLAAAAASSGGGTSGSSSASQTSGFAPLVAPFGTYTVISDPLTYTTAAGQTSVKVQVNVNPKMAAAATQDGPWDVLYKVQRLIGGTWTDQAAVQHSNPDPFQEYDEELRKKLSNSGTASFTVNVSGLTASTAYQFRLLCCLAPVDNVTTFTYPTNGVSLNQIVPTGGGLFIS